MSLNNTLAQIPLKAIINAGLSFESNCFTLKKRGAVWLFISLRSPNLKNFTIELIVKKQIVKKISSSLLGYSNSLSVSWFGSVAEGDVIFLKSKFFSKMTHANVKFLGIHLDDNTMSPFVALALEESYLHMDPKGNHQRSPPSVILISNWNSTNQKCMIPYNGIYFVHASVHAESCIYVLSPVLSKQVCIVSLNLRVNSSGKDLELNSLYKVYIGENSTERSSVLSSTIMYRFSAGDELIFSLFSGEEQSTLSYQIVLYEPLHRNKLAFSLYEKETNLSGKIRFSTVYVNDGLVWDNANSQVKIPVNGLYFVTLSAELNCTEDYSVTVLRNNKQPIIEIDKVASDLPMPDLLFQVLSQAMLVVLQFEDTLHVKTRTKCDEALFSGCLLYLS